MADANTAVKTIAEQIAKAVKNTIEENNKINITKRLANLKISGDQILPNSIEGISLVDGSISTLKINNFEADVANIAVAEIETAVIDTAQIADGAITRAKIQDAAINTAKIEDAAITHAKIGDAAIEEANIKDLSVTTAKINNAAITSAKISEVDAGKIRSGQLDTELVSIFKGGDLSFIWNSYGLYAYAENNGVIDPSTFVRLNKTGLTLQRDGFVECSLDWDGFYLGIQDGSVEITPNDGFVVYDRPRGLGEDTRNPLIQLGRFGYPGNYEYGMRFYKTVNGVTMPTLISKTDGSIWLEDRLSVGTDSDATGNIVIDGANKYIGTSKYVSGALGNGWRISGDGDAVFNNITARGKLAATVFEYEKVSSVGGSLYVAPTIISGGESPIEQINIGTEIYYTIAIEHPFTGTNFESAGRKWKTGDVVSVQGFAEKNGAVYEIRDLRCKITSIDNDGCVLQSLQTADTVGVYNADTGAAYTVGSINLSNGSLADGAMFIFLGAANNNTLVREGIYISANEENSPYIDVYDSTGGDNLKVRLGNLSGITDPDIQKGPLSGYGLYGENVYLKGTFIAQDGKIGNLSIAEIENNLNTLEVEVSSSAGTIIKTGEVFTTTLSATIYRGNIPLSSSEYANYTILWWYSLDGASWSALSNNGVQCSGRTATVNIDSAYYIKCTLNEN